MVNYLHAHPAVVAILAGLFPSVVALLVGLSQSRSAVNAKRLELRHEISTQWLAEFGAAATQYQKCLNRMRSSLGRAMTMDEACDANAAFQKSVEDLMDICAVIVFSFPRHWLAGALFDCVLELHEVSGRVTRRLSQAMHGVVQKYERGVMQSVPDPDRIEAEAVPRPLVSPEEMVHLSGTFNMLRSLANSAIEVRLMQNRFALRRWHLKGDLRAIKSWGERLKGSAVPDE